MPCKYEPADDGECAEAVGHRIDSREERQVVGGAEPDPQHRQDGRDRDTGPGAAQSDEDDGKCSEQQQDNLHRPDGAVVGLEDAKELLDGKGELHGGREGLSR